MILLTPVFVLARKKTARLLCLTLCIGLSACQRTPEQQLLRSVANHVIIPFHEQFAASAQKLKTLSNAFCQQPDTTQWQLLRTQWQTTMHDWQAVKLIGFGPLVQDNQHWKIQFWPDKHNLVQKKINALLNTGDELTVARIQKASVVIQGLSAMEYLLFDHKGGQLALYSNTGHTRRCQLLMAIAAHIDLVGTRLNNAWQPRGGNYLARLTGPGETNTDYPTTEDAILALVDTLITQLEQARRDQLATPLGYRIKGGILTKQTPRPYLAQAWRSRISLQLLHSHLLAAQTLYMGATQNTNNRYGFYHYLKHQAATQTLAEAIRHQFTLVNKQLTLINKPLPDTPLSNKPRSEAVHNPPLPNKSRPEAAHRPPSQQQLEQLYEQFTNLVALLKHKLPAAMGVTTGFNANDGD